MATKKTTPVEAKAPETAPVAAPAAEASFATGSTDNIDSTGKAKGDDQYTPGPRGPEAPIGTKPAPATPQPETVNTVTDKVDSAGSEIADEHAYVPGPRGPMAQRVSPGTFKQ